jgi:hypothetical protein
MVLRLPHYLPAASYQFSFTVIKQDKSRRRKGYSRAGDPTAISARIPRRFQKGKGKGLQITITFIPLVRAIANTSYS